ncbi:universal stress protein [Hydrogenophaga sp.]|uniref:universal stress protein n=1 Tax=Hydrogenophaga sp. TaxID=1904254 RepID=UPI0025B90C1E|nr:universal stress protein [Hydrogenophaga sp.]
MKILLAVDGSTYTKKMLAYLTTHDEVFSGAKEVTLLTVQSPLPSRARAAVGKEIADGYYADEAEKITAPVVKFLQRHGMNPKVIHKVGSAGEMIAKAAEAGKFDLVMMGSHGHSALGNLVMGSVATRVLAHCQVPVLLVR